jgi:hypothetical protein
MKSKVILALVGAVLIPGLAQAKCSIGEQDPWPSQPRPRSTTILPEPLYGGNGAGVTWIQNTSQVPPAHVNFWNSTNRTTSNFVDDRPDALVPNGVVTPPPPPPPNGGGGVCDSANSVVTPANQGFTSFLERTPVLPGLARHQIQLDLTYYEGNSNGVSGERSYWPIAAWQIPMEGPTGTAATLRVDYSLVGGRTDSARFRCGPGTGNDSRAGITGQHRHRKLPAHELPGRQGVDAVDDSSVQGHDLRVLASD